MELLGHSITHFNGTDELDRKLVILHLANAVELILKDMLLDLGESIYKNPKETVTITGCLETLKSKSVTIPYLNKIELLIDERNALQHRFGSPNELTSIFYMNIAEEFFKIILQTHYAKDFEEIIAQFTDQKDLAAFRMRTPTNETELESLKKLSKIHPLGALLAAVSYLDRKIEEFANNIGLEPSIRMRPPGMFLSHRYLERYGIDLPEDLHREMDEVRHIRNSVAHGRKEPTKQEADKCINVVERYERFLETVDKELAKSVVQRIREEREKRVHEERERRELQERDQEQQRRLEFGVTVERVQGNSHDSSARSISSSDQSSNDLR
jgi:hypothetical protein